MPKFNIRLDGIGVVPKKAGLMRIYPPTFVIIDQFRWEVSIYGLLRHYSAIITCLGPIDEAAKDLRWECHIKQGHLTLCSQTLNVANEDLEVGFGGINFISSRPTYQCPDGLPWNGISSATSHFVRDSTLLVKVSFDCSPGLFQKAEAENLKLNMNSFLAPGGTDIVTFILYNKGIEEEEIMVHKAILSRRSTVFKAMFENQMTEASSGKVEIKDMGLTSFKLFLAFLYFDHIELNRDQLKITDLLELINAAEKYDVQELKQVLDLQLVHFCTVQNCPELFQFASNIGLQCEDEIANFAKSHIKALLLAKCG